MKISDEMIEQIKAFEGCRLEAYTDENGIPSIGIGHTGSDVSLGDKISRSEATRMFRRDVAVYEDAVNTLNGKMLEKTRGCGGLTQRQFDAIVSLVYNIGIGAIRKESVFYKILMNGGRNNYPNICRAFMGWDKHHETNPNVKNTTRRAVEAAWYVYGSSYEQEMKSHGITDIVSWAKS